MSEIPEGFREADFGGNFLRQNGPFYLKRSGDSWLVGQLVGEQHVNYIGIAHGCAKMVFWVHGWNCA